MEITVVSVDLYVIKNHVHLHLALIFSTYTTYFLKITSPLYLLDRLFLKQFRIRIRSLSDIQTLAFGSSLYIR